MSVNQYTSVDEALTELARRGFRTNFEPGEGALTDIKSGRTFPPETLTIVEHHRFEGESDPEDMAIVYAIEADDGTRGALVDAFGAYARPGLNELLRKVRIREGE